MCAYFGLENGSFVRVEFQEVQYLSRLLEMGHSSEQFFEKKHSLIRHFVASLILLSRADEEIDALVARQLRSFAVDFGLVKLRDICDHVIKTGINDKVRFLCCLTMSLFSQSREFFLYKRTGFSGFYFYLFNFEFSLITTSPSCRSSISPMRFKGHE